MSDQLTDLPDKPGVWFRDGECWRIVSPTYEGMPAGGLAAAKWDEGPLRCPVPELPQGGWSPAIPASRVAELESELKASKPHALVGKAMIEAFEAIRDAGLADDPPKDECLNAYIETWAKQKARVAELEAEVGRLRTRLLSAAGDDLCRLTQEEIKAMSSGAVQIPPKEEFLASCERFHAQVAGEAGVMSNCLTLAQLVAENERLLTAVEQAYDKINSCLVPATGPLTKAERDAEIKELRYALQSFVDYYEQSGISGDEVEDDDDEQFNGDEKFNVRLGRKALSQARGGG